MLGVVGLPMQGLLQVSVFWLVICHLLIDSSIMSSLLLLDSLKLLRSPQC